MAPGPLGGGLLRRSGVSDLLVAGLLAVSVGLGTALTRQERALREGSARAADPFAGQTFALPGVFEGRFDPAFVL